jgi:hypothetical protein
MSSVAGGLASVAGGGKFANGAITGAFAYLTSPRSGSAAGLQLNEDLPGPASPGDPCGEGKISCTYLTPGGQIVTDHNQSYFDLGDPSKGGAPEVQAANDVHEGVHRTQLAPYVDDPLGYFKYGSDSKNPVIGATWEIEAYGKEIDYINDYVNRFNPPDDIRVLFNDLLDGAKSQIQKNCGIISGARPGATLPAGC